MTTTEIEIQHMPGCRCKEYFEGAEFEAIMVDERRWEEPVHRDDLAGQQIAYGVAASFRTAASAAGVPFVTIRESRWNDRGERIGPRMETRVCEMVEYRLLRESVEQLVEETVQRMVAERGESR